MDIGGWLRSLGLGKYEAAFRDNDIDETVLPNLTAEDLKEMASRQSVTLEVQTLYSFVYVVTFLLGP